MDGPDLLQARCPTRTRPLALRRAGAPAPSAHAGLTLTLGVQMHEESAPRPGLALRDPLGHISACSLPDPTAPLLGAEGLACGGLRGGRA